MAQKQIKRAIEPIIPNVLPADTADWDETPEFLPADTADWDLPEWQGGAAIHRPQLYQAPSIPDLAKRLDELLDKPSRLLSAYPEGRKVAIQNLAEAAAKITDVLDKPRQSLWSAATGGKYRFASDWEKGKAPISGMALEALTDPLNYATLGTIPAIGRGVRWTSKLLKQAEKLPNKGTADEFVRLLEGWGAKGAFKGEELAWNEGVAGLKALGNKPMTRNEALRLLEEGSLKLEDVGKTSYEHLRTLQLPGGENYGETLITAPKLSIAPAQAFEHSHYEGVPNILAHVRHNDRVGPNGEKILHIEEVQSDWHQQGRVKGYLGNLPKGFTVEEDPLGGWYVKNPEGREIVSGRTKQDAIERYGRLNAQIPDAPFKSDWPDLAVKNMVKKAVDEGYDAISWTTAEQQLKRNSFLHHGITEITYDTGEQRLYARGPTLSDEWKVPPEKLPDYLGKEAAEKLLASTPYPLYGEKLVGGHFERGQTGVLHRLEGKDLAVTSGGKLHRDLYDIRIPAAFKKLGFKVEKVDLSGKTSRELPEKIEQMWQDGYITPERMNQLRREQDPLTSYSTQWVVRIPLELKTRLSAEGIPLFTLAPTIPLLAKPDEDTNPPIRIKPLAGRK